MIGDNTTINKKGLESIPVIKVSIMVVQSEVYIVGYGLVEVFGIMEHDLSHGLRFISIASYLG
jgi:hypothetical protein